MSKERSTAEGINMEEHGFRFQFTFPEPDYGEYGADFGEEEECLPRQRKPPEVRNALREKRVAFRQKTGQHHTKDWAALRKYNRANNTKVSPLSLSRKRVWVNCVLSQCSIVTVLFHLVFSV